MKQQVYIYRRLIFPGVVLFVALAAFAWLYTQLENERFDMQTSLQAQSSEVAVLFSAVQQADTNYAILQQYLTQFRAQEAMHLIGTKTRADWIDRIMEGVYRYDVRKAKLNFSVRTPIDGAEFAKLVSVPSGMTRETLIIEGEFQHELDVLNFMQYLRQNLNSVLLTQRCELKSIVSADKLTAQGFDYHFDPLLGNLFATCTMDLLEVHPQPEQKP